MIATEAPAHTAPEATEVDGRILSMVRTLIETKVPMEAWPQEASEALRIALDPGPTSQREVVKAGRLKRHLFGEVPGPEIAASGLPVDRMADRLRADLADLVPFGAGFHLIDYDRAADAWTTNPRR
jgi:hypothetical protein